MRQALVKLLTVRFLDIVTRHGWNFTKVAQTSSGQQGVIDADPVPPGAALAGLRGGVRGGAKFV